MVSEILKRDQNHVTVLGGVTNDSDMDVTMLRVDPITKRLLVAATGGGSGTAVYNEIASGSGTSFTIVNSPTAGTVRVYGNGQRLYPTTDYSISGITITTVSVWNTGDILVDYNY